MPGPAYRRLGPAAEHEVSGCRLALARCAWPWILPIDGIL
jgi:hypothetical protein